MFPIWWKQNENCYKKNCYMPVTVQKLWEYLSKSIFHRITQNHWANSQTPSPAPPSVTTRQNKETCDKLNVKIPGTRIQSSSGALAWHVLEPSFHSQQHEKKKKIWGSEEAQQWGRGCQAVTKNAYAHMGASCESFPHISWEETCPHKTQEMTPTLSRNFYTWISKAMWAAGGTSRSPLPSSSQRPPTSPCF